MLTTLPDLLTMVMVSMRGMFAVEGGYFDRELNGCMCEYSKTSFEDAVYSRSVCREMQTNSAVSLKYAVSVRMLSLRVSESKGKQNSK